MSNAELSLTAARLGQSVALAESHPAQLEPVLVGALNGLTDDAVLALWLAQFERRSQQTVRSYRTQSAKFRLFLRLLHPDWPEPILLGLAKPKDVRDYDAALTHKFTESEARCIVRLTPSELTLFGLTEQPFAKPLAQSSVNQALAVLHAMYRFMGQASADMPQPYVPYNPVTASIRTESRAIRQTERYIPQEGITAMFQHARDGAAQAVLAKDYLLANRYGRALLIITLLFGLWGRRQELCTLRMCDIRRNNQGEWVADLQRKGRQDKDTIPVSAWVIQGLGAFRLSIGERASWTTDDQQPVILSLRARHKHSLFEPIDPQTLYKEVKFLADQTVQSLLRGAAGVELSDFRREHVAQALSRCSPHWFRHTGPSIAINSNAMSVAHASRMLGHASLDTTSKMYYHADQSQMRQGLDSLKP